MTRLEFTTRFNELHKLLFGFAMRITRNVEDARDLLQETALRAYKNKHRFQMGTNFRAWLSTIMKNTFINSYRKNSKKKDLEVPIDKFLFSLENSQVNNGAQTNIMMEELTEMLDNLAEGYRLPFVLFHDGFHYDEIAKQMDIPIGTVKSRIFYARKQLQEMVRNRYGNQVPYR